MPVIAIADEPGGQAPHRRRHHHQVLKDPKLWAELGKLDTTRPQAAEANGEYYIAIAEHHFFSRTVLSTFFIKSKIAEHH